MSMCSHPPPPGVIEAHPVLGSHISYPYHVESCVRVAYLAWLD